MSTVTAGFYYDVDTLHESIRSTNVLLRAANAIRHSVVDLQALWEKPNISRLMWTLVQLMRTYNALRRLYRLLIDETNVAINITKWLREIPRPPGIDGPVIPPEIPPPLSEVFGPLNVTTEAFRENIPMPLNRISLMNLPEETVRRLQRVFEEDAEETVLDAQEILTARILHPEESTGTLEASIGWQPEAFGTRITASAFYAWWVEEGQRTFTGHHYMKGALDLARQRLPEKIRMTLNDIIIEGRYVEEQAEAMRSLFG